MTAAALILAAVLVVLVISERQTHLKVLDAHERERDQWTRERQTLLNRIKPETAQSVIDPNVPVQPPAIRFDDDEDYWQSTGPTKEELAAALERDEA